MHFWLCLIETQVWLSIGSHPRVSVFVLFHELYLFQTDSASAFLSYRAVIGIFVSRLSGLPVALPKSANYMNYMNMYF